jgi:hypothetical protein
MMSDLIARTLPGRSVSTAALHPYGVHNAPLAAITENRTFLKADALPWKRVRSLACEGQAASPFLRRREMTRHGAVETHGT